MTRCVATGLFDANHALNGSEAPNGSAVISACARRNIIKHDGNGGSGSDRFKMSKETFLSGSYKGCHQQTGICASGFCFWVCGLLPRLILPVPAITGTRPATDLWFALSPEVLAYPVWRIRPWPMGTNGTACYALDQFIKSCHLTVFMHGGDQSNNAPVNISMARLAD